MEKATLKERLGYRFDNFMARGTIALIGGLFGVTIAMIVLVALVIMLARLRPSADSAPLGLAEALWQTTMRAIDTGTIAGDTEWSYRLVGFAITLGGIFIASALIGILASGLENRLNELRRGRSRVIEEGHVVILGWSPQIFSMVSELSFAVNLMPPEQEGAKLGRKMCVAVLAERDKVEMEEEIYTKAPNNPNVRVVCRSGNPMDLDDLKIVSPDTARAIIILSPGGPYPDLPVAKTMMALTRDRARRSQPLHIVAALYRPRNLQLARMIGGDEAQVFAVDNLVSRLIAQTCRHAGLSIVYGELFSFDGAAIHFFHAPDLAGITYGEALSRFSNAALIGLERENGQVLVNPAMETVIAPGWKMIAIASSAAALRPAPGAPQEQIALDAILAQAPAAEPLEKLLILGWNHRGPIILEQLSYYIPSDSEVRVFAPVAPLDMQAEYATLQSRPMNVVFEQGNPMDRPTLEKLAAMGFQYVVILSPEDAPDVQMADATTMVALLHLRDIAKQTRRTFSIVSEILDVRNRDLAEVTSADDVIISERLIALALTQIAVNKAVVSVFMEFLSAGGPEIYLKPAGNYITPGKPLNFHTVVESARRKGQSAIGYRLLAQASAPEHAFGVHLNPDKSAMITFSPEDRIIVLAET